MEGRARSDAVAVGWQRLLARANSKFRDKFVVMYFVWVRKILG